MANRNHEYDPRKMQDRTGMVFRAVPQNLKESDWIHAFQGEPIRYECTECGATDRFMLLVDDHAESGVMMIGCGHCKKWTRPLEVRAPQMNDNVAKALGLYIPGSAIEFDIDVHER